MHQVKGTNMKKIKPMLKLLKHKLHVLKSHLISGCESWASQKCSPGTSVASPGRAVNANTQPRQTLRPKLPREHKLSVI